MTYIPAPFLAKIAPLIRVSILTSLAMASLGQAAQAGSAAQVGAVAPVAPAAQAVPVGDLLRFIRAVEVNGNSSAYDTPYAGFPLTPPKALTSMNIREVLAFQTAGKGKTKSTAMGAYQILHKTLDSLVKTHGISKEAKFDRSLQDRLAALLIEDCQEARAQGITAYGNCLAGIWAALPLLSGKNKGKSKYHGVAGNKARITAPVFQSLLEGRMDVADLDLSKEPKPLVKDPLQETPNVQNSLQSKPLSMKRIALGTAKANNRKDGRFAPSIHALGFDPYALE